jgi:predicted RNase H-like nuclease (RuvC/YqgF family)
MYNNLEGLTPEEEKELRILENQITELFTLLEKKEMQVSQLKDENAELRVRIQNLQQQLNQPQQQLSPPQHTNQQIDTIRVPNQQISLATSPSTSVSTLKRKCPKCGAMGFAIKEVDDKSRLISYVPRRIYAKKRVCTKCRHEF